MGGYHRPAIREREREREREIYQSPGMYIQSAAPLDLTMPHASATGAAPGDRHGLKRYVSFVELRPQQPTWRNLPQQSSCNWRWESGGTEPNSGLTANFHINLQYPVTASRFIVRDRGLLFVGATVELQRLADVWPFSPVHSWQLIEQPCENHRHDWPERRLPEASHPPAGFAQLRKIERSLRDVPGSKSRPVGSPWLVGRACELTRSRRSSSATSRS